MVWGKKSVLPFVVFWALFIVGAASQLGCMSAYEKSVGGDTEQVFSQIYVSDFNTVWLSVLTALKSSPLDIANRESGFVRTRWIDNTSERNFFDSFGTGKFYLKARYRIRVSLAKGFFNGSPSVKSSVFKEQMVQRDVLEGWQPVVTDSLEEKTLLYRIGRLIAIQKTLNEIEELKAQSTFEKSKTEAFAPEAVSPESSPSIDSIEAPTDVPSTSADDDGFED